MRSWLLAFSLLLAGTTAAFAQSAPEGLAQGAPDAVRAPAPRPAAARTGPAATFALRGAYRTIGQAEALGIHSKYLDSARTHYRNAVASYAGGNAAKAGAEGRLASDLARASLAEHPAPAPKDLPAPPTAAPMAPGGPPMGMMPPRPPMDGGAPMAMRMGPPGFGGAGGNVVFSRTRQRGGFGRGVDPALLGQILKFENSAEAKALADEALNASIASQRAALASNLDESARLRRLGGSLAAAVRDLARVNHPERFQMQRRPDGQRMRPMGAPQPRPAGQSEVPSPEGPD